MTNSTVKNKKRKGPIRFELIIPVFIVTALIYSYFHFFFDRHLKSAIEHFGSRMHGAQIDISDLSTSVFDLELIIKGLEVTHKKDPSLNIFAFDQLKFELVTDAILRGKFVVEQSSLEGINWLSKRKSPGKLYPPDENQSSALKDASDQVLESVKKQTGGSALGDVAEILSGVDPKDQLDAIRGELESEKKIKQLETELKEKEKQWKERIANLTNKEELESLKRRAKEYKFDKKDPIGSIKKANDLLKDAKNKVQEFERTSKDLKSDVEKYSKTLESVDNWIEDDIKALEERVGIPSVNIEDVGLDVIAELVGMNAAELRKYVALAREYMPPKKDPAKAQSEKLIPPTRGEGIDYQFPITTGYPTWWLKSMSLTSSGKGGDYSGELTGALTDLSSNPQITKKPTTFKVTGDFPRQKIMGINLAANLDHTREPAKDQLSLRVASAPVKKITFSKSDKLNVALDDGSARNDFEATIVGDEVSLSYAATIDSPNWIIESPKKVIKENLTPILTSIPSVSLSAKAKGTWSDLDWSLRSNIGPEIAKGVRNQLNAKVAEARAKVEKIVKEKVEPQKEKIKSEIAKVQAEIDKLIGSKKEEIEGISDSAIKDVEGAKDSSAVDDKVDKAVEKLKKKFKLKF